MSVNFSYGVWSNGEDRKLFDGGVLPSYPTEKADFNDCNESELSVPAWETDPGDWDYEDAKKLAEKLLLLDSFGDKAPNTTYDLTSLDMCAGTGINPRFKTEFCRNFREKGSCQYGDHCQFAHGKNELRHDIVRHSKYKTKLCQKFWIAGYCAYGARCNFIHQQDETFEAKSAPVGLRPFPPNIRRMSESSGDSGIEFGFNSRFIKDQSRIIYPPMDAGKPKFGGSSPGERSNGLSPPARYGDLNVYTDLNSNLNGDMKGFYAPPHPENNPIQPAAEKRKDLDYYRSCEAGIWSNNF